MEESIGVRVSPETKSILERWAATSGNRSISSLVRELIEEGINRHYRQLPLAVETPDEPTEESPAAQMQAAGCKPLVEA